MSYELSAIAAIIIIDELLYEMEEEEMQPKKKRRIWSKNRCLEKEEFSNEKLLKEIIDCRNYIEIDDNTFGKLFNLVKHKITKADTVMREAISAKVRLVITLQYLATGKPFADLTTSISPQAIGNIVIETCDAINKELKNYIKTPTTSAEWLQEAEKFYEESKFPHCLGVLDGKHVKIKKPPHSGSNYFNYKKTFSIILMAIVNSNSEFLMVDIAKDGRISDSVVFNNTKFFKKLEGRELNLPEPYPAFDDTPIPYVFVADETFALHPNIMKPYAQHLDLTSSQILFNKRLGSARVNVENAFRILAARFRVLNTTIALVPEKARKIVLSCCYLHNFIKKEMADKNIAVAEYIDGNSLFNLEAMLAEDSSTDAKIIRNNLCEAIFASEDPATIS